MPKQVWKAFDGSEFETEKDCSRYEELLKKLQEEKLPDSLKRQYKKTELARKFDQVLRLTREELTFLEEVKKDVDSGAANSSYLKKRRIQDELNQKKRSGLFRREELEEEELL